MGSIARWRSGNGDSVILWNKRNDLGVIPSVILVILGITGITVESPP